MEGWVEKAQQWFPYWQIINFVARLDCIVLQGFHRYATQHYYINGRDLQMKKINIILS